MSSEKTYRRNDLCEVLGISVHTLQKWYQWERYSLSDGTVTEKYLPEPHVFETERGKPQYWTEEQLEQLKAYRDSIVVGRKGKYGKYTNPHWHEKEVNNG